MENISKSRLFIFLLLILVVGALIGVGGSWIWNRYMANPGSPVSQVEQAQIKELIEKVGKLVILPTGEEPVVATINDAAALIKEQVFYKNSKNGDVVLVYQKAAKAIIYSPSRNIIVNVGPIFLQDDASKSTTTQKN